MKDRIKIIFPKPHNFDPHYRGNCLGYGLNISPRRPLNRGHIVKKPGVSLYPQTRITREFIHGMLLSDKLKSVETTHGAKDRQTMILYIRPSVDFHVVRCHKDGTYSHAPHGQIPRMIMKYGKSVTNVDDIYFSDYPVKVGIYQVTDKGLYYSC